MEKGLSEKVDRALRLIKAAAASAGPGNPLEIAYSGGKDSDVILELAKMAGVEYRAIYKNTTIDPPGTIRHCLDMGAEIVRPKRTFAEVIRAKGYPTRLRRFCCAELKEYKILDRSVQGIRRSESSKRAGRYHEPTVCRFYGSRKQHVEVFLPILEWSTRDVAEFIWERGIRCHPLYYDAQGTFHPERRLGCMACPQKADNGRADFMQHPGLVKMWLRNGETWWNTHGLSNTKKKFRDHYELFVRNVFFNSYESFDKAVNGMFGRTDCKAFLEQHYGISL